MRLLLVLLLMTITACAGAPASLPDDFAEQNHSAPFAATPTYGLAGQSVVIQATQESLALTRAVLDAQSADATQRAAVATADWQATQSSLSVQQTQAAMVATANESARQATHESAKATGTAQAQSDIATAEAADTATARAFNGLLLQQAITSTGTALAVRAESLATQESAKAEAAIYGQMVQRQVWEFLQWAIVIIVVAVGVVAVYFAVLIGLDRRQHHYEMLGQILLRAKYTSEIERAKKDQVLIIQHDGRSYYDDPQHGLVPLDDKIELSVQNKAQDSKLRAACKRLVFAAVQLGQDGERHPFSERALVIRNAVVTHPETGEPWVEGYRMLIGILKSESVGVLYAKDRKATTWAEGWSLTRFEQEFDLLPLPKWPEGPLPEVRVTLRSSADSAVSRSFAVPQIEEESD